MPQFRDPANKGVRALRRGRCSLPRHVYHVTAATEGREPLFTDLDLARIVVRALRHEQSADRCHTLAYALMPDHLHWLLQLDDVGSLSGCVNNVEAHSARQIRRRAELSEPIWQKGFYDRAIRSDEDLVGVARYIVANPLRAGIAKRLGQYPHWYAIWLQEPALRATVRGGGGVARDAGSYSVERTGDGARRARSPAVRAPTA